MGRSSVMGWGREREQTSSGSGLKGKGGERFRADE